MQEDLLIAKTQGVIMQPNQHAQRDIREITPAEAVSDLLQSNDLYADIFGKDRAYWQTILYCYPNSISLGRMLIEHFADDNITAEVLEFFLSSHIDLEVEIFNQLLDKIMQYCNTDKVTSEMLGCMASQPQITEAGQEWFFANIKHEKVTDEVLKYLANNPRLTEARQQWLLDNIKHRKVTGKVLGSLAGNPKLSEARQQQLFVNIMKRKIVDKAVLGNLAANRNLAATVQQLLLDNIEDRMVTSEALEQLAGNSHCTAANQRQLLVKIAHKKITVKALIYLASNSSFDALVQQQLLFEDIGHDKINFWGLTHLAGNSNIADVAQQWLVNNAGDTKVNQLVLGGLAKNPRLIEAAQKWLFDNMTHEKVTDIVLAQLAGNSKFTQARQQWLLDNITQHLSVLEQFVGNPHLIEAAQQWPLNNIAREAVTERVLAYLAGNLGITATTQQLLLGMVQEQTIITSDVLMALAANPAINATTVQWFIDNRTTQPKITNLALKKLSSSPHYSDDIVIATIARQIMANPAELQLFVNISSSEQLEKILTGIITMIMADQTIIDKTAALELILTHSPVAYLVKLGSNYTDVQLAKLLNQLYSKHTQLCHYPIELPGRHQLERYLKTQARILKNQDSAQQLIQLRTIKQFQQDTAELQNQLEHSLELIAKPPK